MDGGAIAIADRGAPLLFDLTEIRPLAQQPADGDPPP
jgi:hypothetical protein